MKKIFNTLILIVLFAPILLSAQSQTTLSANDKIDSIYSLQKKMYTESKTGPLSNKKYGVELNLFRLLIMDQATTVSGTFSLFDVNRQAEIAFPIYYQHAIDQNDLTEFTVDCHYRYFLGKQQNGFYLSAFTRFAYLRGTLGNNFFGYTSTDNFQKDSEAKMGIGFGIGVRKFSYRGLYWGSSLSFGRYLIGHNERFMGSFLTLDDDAPYILDIELLKFGWAF